MYIIVEIQTNANGTVGILTYTAPEWRNAQQIYHEKLAYAAMSTLPRYAVVLMDNSGHVQESRYYSTEHEQMPEEV